MLVCLAQQMPDLSFMDLSSIKRAVKGSDTSDCGFKREVAIGLSIRD